MGASRCKSGSNGGPNGRSTVSPTVSPTVSSDACRSEPFEDVPAELLEHPPRESLPDVDRDCAAVLLDRWLVRLSRREAAGRLRVGRLAHCLLDCRGHHRLGFARLGDYASERLGLSARELQSAARVWRVVDGLPALARAYGSGRLNWTKLRLIASVVTQETVATWVAAAAASTSRELAQLVQTHASRVCNAGAITEPDAGIDDESRLDGEPRAEVQIRCPVSVRSLWRQVRELASRSSGKSLASWQALECVAAEATSGAWIEEAAGGVADGGPARIDEPRLCAASTRADEGGNAVPAAPAIPWHDGEDITPLRAALDPLTSCGSSADGLGWFETEFLAGGAQRDLENPTPARVDTQLRSILTAMQATDWQMGRLLRTFARLRLYRNAGFGSLADYVSERLAISPRKARALVRLEGDASCGRSALAEAYRDGRISWVRALALLPIVSERYVEPWIERACAITVRRLIDEVAWARDVADRAAGCIAIAPPPPASALESSAVEAERQLRARFDAETAARMLSLAPRLEVVLRFSGPLSVMSLLHDALHAYSRAGEAPWQAFERMLLHAERAWREVPRHRNPIHERDGWRCRVPACSSRRNLQEHHILFRSHGGGNERDNRVSLCAWHHLRGIHAGIVRARGDANREILWHLGSGARGTDEAFLRLRNDVFA